LNIALLATKMIILIYIIIVIIKVTPTSFTKLILLNEGDTKKNKKTL